MPAKVIQWYGQKASLTCDGRCDKAWGRNGRPKLYYMEEGNSPRALRPNEEPRDEDDYVYVGDASLGTAPADPGTWEGDDTKPSGGRLRDAGLMNKWCARECERSTITTRGEPVRIRNLASPRPNMGKRAAS